MYYFFVEDNKINGKGQCRQIDEGVLNFEVPKEMYEDDIEKFIYKDGQIVLNPNYEQEIAAKRKKAFLQDFFKVPSALNDQDLYYRKSPKGYSSAVESINTAFNIVATLGNLPTGSLIFYEEPDFTKEEECTEEWLVNHQVKNEVMTPTEFGSFYAKFITSWNSQEHES